MKRALAIAFCLACAAAPPIALAGEASAPPECWQDACESAMPAYAEALTGTDDALRERAAALLARLGTPDSARALEPLAAAPGPLQAVAIAGVAWSGQPHQAHRWLAGLRSPDPQVRRVAVWSTGAQATESALRPLLLILEGAEPAVQLAWLDAVGLARLDGAFLDVAALGRNSSDAVRAASLRALAALPLPGARLLHAERLAAEPAAHVRAQGQHPLGPSRPEPGERLLSGPLDAEALARLAAQPDAPVGQRAEAAWRLALEHHGLAPLRALPPSAPALIRYAAALARHRAGDWTAPGTWTSAFRQLVIGRLAHEALQRPSDAWLVHQAWELAPERYGYTGARAEPAALMGPQAGGK